MSGDALWHEARKLLALEGLALDRKDWDLWLSLYMPEASYWVPAWSDEGEPTSDPRRELSLIYYRDRGGLEDRVFRLRTGKSPAATLSFRTCHFSQLMSVDQDGDRLLVRANWQTQSLVDGEPVSYYGWADYVLRSVDDHWRIASKTTTLVNDRSNTLIDFYLL